MLWARPARVLSAEPGEHRFLWDMHYPQLPGVAMEPSAEEAVPHDTPLTATSPWVMPGHYTVRLIAGGKAQAQPLTVVVDPRVKTPVADLEAQFTLAKSVYEEMIQASTAIGEIDVLREQLKTRSGEGPVATAGASIESKLDAIAGREARGRGGIGGGRGRGMAGPANLVTVRTQLARLEHEIENADAAPTTAQVEACGSVSKPLAGLLDQWQQLKATGLKSLNAQLIRDHLAQIDLDANKFKHGEEEQIDMGDVE